MAQLFDGVPAARGLRHATGALGSQRRLLGFRDDADARYAQHDLRSVFCRRRDFLRLRDGADAHHSDAQDAAYRGSRHHLASRQPRQGHPVYLDRHHLFVFDRSLPRVLRSGPHRNDDLPSTIFWSSGVSVRWHGAVQLPDSAAALFAADPHQYDLAVYHLDLRQYRHVAGALRADRRFALGRDDSLAMEILRAEAHRGDADDRELRLVPDELLSVHEIPADRFDDGAQGRDRLA